LHLLIEIGKSCYDEPSLNWLIQNSNSYRGMRFLRKIIFNNALGISVTVSVSSNCKTDGG